MSFPSQVLYSAFKASSSEIQRPFSVDGQELLIKFECALRDRGWNGLIIRQIPSNNYTITNSRHFSEESVSHLLQVLSEETNWQATLKDFRDKNNNLLFSMRYQESADVNLSISYSLSDPLLP